MLDLVLFHVPLHAEFAGSVFTCHVVNLAEYLSLRHPGTVVAAENQMIPEDEFGLRPSNAYLLFSSDKGGEGVSVCRDKTGFE